MKLWLVFVSCVEPAEGAAGVLSFWIEWAKGGQATCPCQCHCRLVCVERDASLHGLPNPLHSRKRNYCHETCSSF